MLNTRSQSVFIRPQKSSRVGPILQDDFALKLLEKEMSLEKCPSMPLLQ